MKLGRLFWKYCLSIDINNSLETEKFLQDKHFHKSYKK